MNRKQLDTAVPMVYAIFVVASVLFFRGAFLPIVIVGAMLLGLYYAVRRRGDVGGGRNRNRNRIR